MVKVKFLTSIIKQGKLRKPGEEMDLPMKTALNLANRGTVEIPGKKVIKVKREVEVLTMVDAKPAPKEK